MAIKAAGRADAHVFAEIPPAGKVTAQAAITTDWTATLLALTGTKAAPNYPLDGVDLTDVLTGTRAAFDRTLFWRNRVHSAARVGRWKYLRENGQEHLFDLAADPGEKAELKFIQKDTFEKVRTQYEAWNAQMLPSPVAQGGAEKGKGKGKAK